MKKIQEAIEVKKKKISDLEIESELAEMQLEKAQNHYEAIKAMREKYQVYHIDLVFLTKVL